MLLWIMGNCNSVISLWHLLFFYREIAPFSLSSNHFQALFQAKYSLVVGRALLTYMVGWGGGGIFDISTSIYNMKLTRIFLSTFDKKKQKTMQSLPSCGWCLIFLLVTNRIYRMSWDQVDGIKQLHRSEISIVPVLTLSHVRKFISFFQAKLRL